MKLLHHSYSTNGPSAPLFMLANLFSLSVLPLVLSEARPLGVAVADLLCGEGSFRWREQVRQFVGSVAMGAVLAFFFVEWAMVAVAVAPAKGPTVWVGVGVIAVVGVFGWRFFVKAGRRATKRFHEALTAEERRESLERTTTVTVPEGAIARIALPVSSPAIGGTVVTLNIRAKTGASIVSVVRGGVSTRNIGPEWEFRAGDILVALGDHPQIAALKDLLGVTS